MHPSRLALLALLAACPGPRAPGPVASCPEAKLLLDEAAAARAQGALFRALARAEAANRACASDETRRAAAELRAELRGPGAPPAPPAPEDAAEVRAAAIARLSGEPARALARLRPIAARLDAAGLAELSRAEAASRHAAEARAALEKAAARAELGHGGRGRWRWQKTGVERTVRLAFTPDGARLVSADREGLIRVWDTAGGHELASMRAHGWPNSVDVSPDGAWIATAEGNGPVEIWDAATGQRLLERADDAPVLFSPEGHLLMASAKQDGLVEIELPSGKEVARFGAGWPRELALGRDRIYGAVEDAQRKPSVVVWERGGEHRKLEERPLPAPAYSLRVTPRGELIALFRDKIVVYEPDGKPRLEIAGAYASIALAPDGKRLLASAGEGGVKLFELASGQLIQHTETGPGWVVAAQHPHAALFATAGAEGIAIWSLATGERTARIGPPSAALSVAFDAGGRRLAVGSASGAASIWDLADGRVTSVTPRPGVAVTKVAFGAGGVLATASAPPRSRALGRLGSRTGTVAVWDARGARRWSQELEELGWIGFRPGTDTLATASLIASSTALGPGVTLWDPGGAPQQTLMAESHASFAWSPDGARLAYPTRDELVLAPLDGGGAAKLDVSAALAELQPGGGLIAAAGAAGYISLWDVATRQLRLVIIDEGGTPAALAWAPGGGVLASAAGDAVRLWDPRTGARLATLAAHAAVAAIALRPDGRLLAAACDDGLVELWSIADATLVAMLAAPGEGRGLVLAPDGAVDGALADDDPLFWSVGPTTLPGRAAWDREAVPGLLPARLARVPAEAAPRANLPGAAPPPAPAACLPAATEDDEIRLVSARAPDDATLSLCALIQSMGDPARLPACFLVDVATGAARPRAPTPNEVLGRPDPDPAIATVTLDGARATVCRAGACRELAFTERSRGASPQIAVSDDGRLVAAIFDQGGIDDNRIPAHAVVHDVATGRRLSRFEVGITLQQIQFLGDALLVTSTQCAGPCFSSRLYDPRTGKRLGAVGGAQAINTSELSPARVAGDVWAFNDWGTATVVYQDVRTGRVVRRVERPWTCPPGAYYGCEIRMLHTGAGVAIFATYRHIGEITILDARGRIVAQHRAPMCKP